MTISTKGHAHKAQPIEDTENRKKENRKSQYGFSIIRSRRIHTRVEGNTLL